MSYAAGMRTPILAIAAALALAGCHEKDKYDEVIADLDALAARMCACADVSCADQVTEDARAYRKTIQDRIGRDTKDKPTEAQEAQGRAADERMRACRKKLAPSGPPSP